MKLFVLVSLYIKPPQKERGYQLSKPDTPDGDPLALMDAFADWRRLWAGARLQRAARRIFLRPTAFVGGRKRIPRNEGRGNPLRLGFIFFFLPGVDCDSGCL